MPVPVNWMSANDGQVAESCRIAKRVVKCGPEWDPADEREAPFPRSNELAPGGAADRQRAPKRGLDDDAPNVKKG